MRRSEGREGDFRAMDLIALVGPSFSAVEREYSAGGCLS
jgi:hypothetical protein